MPVGDGDRSQGSLDARVARLAARQHGVVARAQLIALGATKGDIEHRRRVGRWEPAARGVIRIAGGVVTWRQQLMAASLASGEGSAISHRAAAALWRLAGTTHGIVELTVPRSHRTSGPWIVHRCALDAADVGAVEGIPVTLVERTLLDLGSVVTLELLEEAVEDALRRKLTSIRGLRWRLDRSGPRAGVAALRAVLDAHAPGATVTENTFEVRLRRVLRRAGLPEPVAQYEIRDGGRVVARADFAYPEARLVIEADGFRWHSGRAAFDRDRARGNGLTLLGWRVLRITWQQLRQRPDEVAEIIRAALAATPMSTPLG